MKLLFCFSKMAKIRKFKILLKLLRNVYKKGL